jgi:hypothetical protein
VKTYSTWNESKGAWDYYQAQGDLRAGVFAEDAPRRIGHRLGLTPEEAARSLPASARHVGSGPTAQGMVASRNGGLGAFEITPLTLIVGAGIAWLAWKKFK